MVRESGFPPERTLIDHNNEETLASLGFWLWAGHSIYPKTKMDEPRMVALVKNYALGAHAGELGCRLGRQ